MCFSIKCRNCGSFKTTYSIIKTYEHDGGKQLNNVIRYYIKMKCRKCGNEHRTRIFGFDEDYTLP